MPYDLTIHFDNADGLIQPHLTIQYEGGGTTTFAATGNDGYGLIFQATVTRPQFRFRFQEASAGGRSEPDLLERDYTPLQVHTDSLEPDIPTMEKGQEFYVALQRRGIDTEMVVYPRTPHGPREPRLLMDVTPRIMNWFSRYLKRNPGGEVVPPKG